MSRLNKLSEEAWSASTTSVRSKGDTLNNCVAAAAVTVLLAAAAAMAVGPAPRGDADAAIAHLIDFVGKSGCTFVRNGTPYTGAKAAAHMKSKYRYFKNQIKTPEDFIRLAATKSIQTGQPYMIRTKRGVEFRSDEWMTKALKEYRTFGGDVKSEKRERTPRPEKFKDL